MQYQCRQDLERRLNDLVVDLESTRARYVLSQELSTRWNELELNGKLLVLWIRD